MASYEGTYVDPNFPDPHGPNDAPIIIYGYTPSLVVGVLGVVLFFIASIAHLYLLFRHRTWYFCTITIGTVMEVVGYVFRILSSQQDPYSVTWFVVPYFFIVVAPVFFSAGIYALVSVLINTYGPRYSPIPSRVVLGVFISSDIVATIVQITGSALVGVKYSNRENPTTPNNVLLAGLAFQVFSFAVFLLVLFLTLWKARQSPVAVSHSFLATLIMATLAVYLRTCFRLAETAEGLMQFLSTHEAFFGSLEFAPIVVAIYLLIFRHPGRWLRASATKTMREDVEKFDSYM